MMMQNDSFETADARIEPLVGQLLNKLEATGGVGIVDVDQAWMRVRPVDVARLRVRSWGQWIAGAGVIAAVAVWILPNVKPANNAPYKVYTTATRQRATIMLASGTQVTLAPSTNLRVRGNEAILDGQAVFTVLHQSDAPFTVRSGSTVTRVLGTTFAVRKYSSDSAVRVIVAEGRVSFQNNVLAAGDMGVAPMSESTVSVVRDGPVTAALAWTSGRLVFNRTPLRDVVPDVERWYGIQIKLADPAMGARTVTTSLDVENSGEALQLIAELVEASVDVHGVTVVMSPRSSRIKP